MKPWWQSITIWGSLGAIVSTLLAQYDISVGSGIFESFPALIGAVIAIYGRFRAKQSISPIIE